MIIKLSNTKVALYALLGPIAWTLHFMWVYVLFEFGCISGMSGMGMIFKLLTIVLLAICLFAFYKSWQLNSSLKQQNPAATSSALAKLGIYNNALFGFIIIYQSVPYFYFGGECL